MLPPPSKPQKLKSGSTISSPSFRPCTGGITNLLLTPLVIYTFAASSGGHASPTITPATFFARIISFPRAVLYIASQTEGGPLAGFGIHTAYGSRVISVGDCYVDTSLVPVDAALVIELSSCLILIFLAFGEALDPRQTKIFGRATGPALVGVVLGVVCWATAFTRPGYIGASKLLHTVFDVMWTEIADVADQVFIQHAALVLTSPRSFPAIIGSIGYVLSSLSVCRLSLTLMLSHC